MKIVSFNVNGLRARLHQLYAIIEKFQPDIIALQETKVSDPLFPTEKISKYGYHAYCYGQKQYYGVALLTLHKLFNIRRGFSKNDENEHSIQKRIIMADIIKKQSETITIINGYFPQGGNIHCSKTFKNKEKFYMDLQKYIKKHYHANSLILILGDMNIAPTDLDIGIGKKNYELWIAKGKCSFLPEERQWIDQLINWGLTDVFRYIYPKNNHRCYSWFDYRSNNFKDNKGLRIDLLLATQPLAERCRNIDIIYEIRAMKQPSDHAPIIAEFDIE